jgi:hypothetical protein
MDAVSATIAMAEAQARMGLHDDAISELRKAVRVHPRNLEIHEILGRILFQQQRFEAALPHLQRVVRKKTDSGELNMLVGDCALSTGRSKAAQRSFERCIAISFRPDTALANVGRSLIARRKAQVAWDRLHEAFVSGGSVSEELHVVLEMCAPLVAGEVPALAASFAAGASNISSSIDAPPNSIEAMAGIVQSDIIDPTLDIGFGLLGEEEDSNDNRLQISMPGAGLDTPESRALWDEPLEELAAEEPQWQHPEDVQGGWIDDDHWDSVPIPEPVSVPQPVVEQISDDETIFIPEASSGIQLPFGVGVAPLAEVEVEETSDEICAEVDEEEVIPEVEFPVVESTVDESTEAESIDLRPEPARQEMPLPGLPVLATVDVALSELAGLPKQQRVWCWTTSYGEVPWGMELLKSRPDDRVEAAAAELTAWSMQNPEVWLAIDLQKEGRVPVDLNNVGGTIAGLNNPVILLVPDEHITEEWPVWGQTAE